jgi:hypothetical protein
VSAFAKLTIPEISCPIELQYVDSTATRPDCFWAPYKVLKLTGLPVPILPGYNDHVLILYGKENARVM